MADVDVDQKAHEMVGKMSVHDQRYLMFEESACLAALSACIIIADHHAA